MLKCETCMINRAVLWNYYLLIDVSIPAPGDVERPGDVRVEWKRSVDGIRRQSRPHGVVNDGLVLKPGVLIATSNPA